MNKSHFLEKYHPRFFSALIEFHQGSPLVTIWSQNLLHINITDFFYYVGNMHSIGKVGEILIPPTITQSSFNSIPYFSITIQIPDVEARGFLRSITLIIAHDHIKPIISENLIKMMKLFQENAMKLFLEEIPKFFLGVKFLCENLKENDMRKPTLITMVQEMEPILQQFNIKTENSDRDESVTLSKIVTVNNELRDVRDLIKWDENLNELIKIISLLNLSSDLPSKSNNQSEIDFGFSSISPQNFLYFTSSNSIYLASFDQKICQSGVFGHLVFSLLSGFKINLVSDDIEKALDLAEILINFIPLFQESDLLILNENENKNVIKSHKIVISKSLVYEQVNDEKISVIDLNENYYQGLICSEKSFVWQFAKINKNENLRVFAAKTSFKLKAFADKFVRFAFNFMKNEFQNQHQFFSMMDLNGFHKEDLPAFCNWMSFIPSFKNIVSLINNCSNWTQNIGTLWI